jgi:polysaccharide biosynthesis protein PslA
MRLRDSTRAPEYEGDIMTVVSGSLSKTHDARTESKAGNSRQSSVPRMLVIETLRIYDIGAFALAGTLGYAFYVVPNPANINRYPGTIILVSLVAATMCHVCGAYRDRAVFSRSLGARQAIFGWLVAFALVVVAAFALKVSESYSRGWAGIWLVSATGFLLVGRYLLSVWTVRLAQRGAFAYRSLIVGTGSQAARLAAHIKARGDVRTQIVGFVDYQRLDGKSDDSFHGFPLVANLNDMMALIRSDACNEVIIALPWSEEKQIEQLTLLLAMAPVRIRLAPDLAGFNFADRRMTPRAGVPMLTLFDRPISGWSGVVKGIEDQAVALVALVLLVPVMLAIAVAVKIESPGPVLFRQRRLGLNNNLFGVWKFRTMRWECTDADASRQTTKGDPRVTRVGRFLRRWSLDELPQFFNVLRGEMSIVGPRPHAVATKAGGKLFQDVVDRYAARHRVKPGITGWAQVNGWRGETNTIDKIRTRVEFDLYYIDNWSVWFDIYIIGRTFGAIFRAERAY